MKKKVLTIILIVCICAIYSVMFGFSAQNGEESGGLSFFVSKKLVEFADFFSTEAWSVEEVDTKAELIEFFVRKTAHFCEYAVLGFCEFGLAVMWMKNGKRRVILIAGILLLSGMIDEIHQMFVPGRYPSIWDVLLDTAGGLTGMFLFAVVYHITLRRKKLTGQTDG